MTSLQPTPVRFEHARDGFGIGAATPRLSWQLPAAPADFATTGYELELTDVAGAVTTVAVESTDQVLVPWPFAPLGSRARGSVRVRMTGTAWSEPSPFETTLLAEPDWSARFVSPRSIAGIGEPAPILHGHVEVPTAIVAARLHVTALGVHVTSINGTRVGDEHLAPGWTSYANRLRFRTHDVTGLVREGTNDVDILLGNGWYRGQLGFAGRRAIYGDRLAALAQLEITHADGTVTTLGTGPDWTATASNVLADDLYDGQTTDRRGVAGEPDAVDVLDEDLGRLVAPDGPPVRTIATVPAVEVTRSPSGRQLVDFGVNIVGWVRLTVRGGAPGQEITIRHAEVLENGELAVRALRAAKATDVHLLVGDVQEVLEPALTFHGFRYAEITGIDVVAADAEAVVIGSDLRRTGEFGCSEPDVETLHANVVRSMQGNFLDIPTDCPQRAERLGWTGDIQVFAPTATFLADCAGFLTSWTQDLAAEQHPDGSVPYVVPDVLGTSGQAAAAWGDAATVVPWTLYQRFGDLGVLAAQFDSMRSWVDKQAALARPDRVWAGGFQFGDWLDPAAPPDAPWAAKTDPDIVATAHLAYSARIVADAATALGRGADAHRYAELAQEAAAAFAREYVSPSGRIVSDAPTAYAMALVWGLLADPVQRDGAGRRLADLVRAEAFRVGTGFVGTPLITDALSMVGEHHLAYRLLLERGCPSWLYPVSMGATTIWERWDSMLPDGSVNPGDMVSFNHYALGAVADWLHRVVAGLAPAAPGYRELRIAPVPGGGLTHASARHDTPYGPAAVAWRRAGGRLVVDVEVPFGTTATVALPGEPAQRVGHGEHRFDVADPVAARPLETVRDVLDDAALWAALVAAAADLGVSADPVHLAERLSHYFDSPAATLPEAIAPSYFPGAEQVHAQLLKIITEHRENAA
ncbi:family 78 glycoside hydrolase catalytic domain [Pseudonocardia sp. GCM10023141]|uniref:family 78 glycoside hydrolase catalytic domain n=1 Tax=Pseudonocardia sp. GCM10023141 TaxID=3252653 RepID=UPI00360ECF9F